MAGVVSDYRIVVQGVGEPIVHTVQEQAAGIQALTNSLLAGNSNPALLASIALAWNQGPFNCKCPFIMC